MTAEAEEIVDAIRAEWRERTGAGPLPQAIAAAPRSVRGRWAVASDGDYQVAALLERGGLRVWWRNEFSAPEWQPYEWALLPFVLWLPADPANLPAGWTLPEETG